ncbi:MAG TPA: hypothetical protein VFR34_13660 [Paracoccaceae bacterium]|nr:hypothetical protein [Paracoccaceae bacterium]
MKLFKNARRLTKEESSAMTVDWVVLTAAIVGLVTAVILLVLGGTEHQAADISGTLAGVTVDH